MKIVSPDILHKSDAGGVRRNLKDPDEIREAFNKIMENARAYNPNADIKGVLVAPMANDGLEVIIGTKIDDQFGPVIMFGIGGIMVEVLKDVVFRVLPISPYSAKNMINEIKSVKLLDGFRGRPPVDRKALKRLLLTVSEIIGSYPEIQEMDFNPVILYEEGLNVVDARIILKK
jgi:acetyltransferase